MIINIEKLIPKFIMDDPNGYAIAKAIEAGFRKASEIVDDGKRLISDYDTMPEWRLDELAWETNCIYNYSATVDQKRKIIKNAIGNARLYGTPASVSQNLEAYFVRAVVKEGTTPYHFSVSVWGDMSQRNIANATDAINRVKNVRSVLDGITRLSGVLDAFILDTDIIS